MIRTDTIFFHDNWCRFYSNDFLSKLTLFLSWFLSLWWFVSWLYQSVLQCFVSLGRCSNRHEYKRQHIDTFTLLHSFSPFILNRNSNNRSLLPTSIDTRRDATNAYFESTRRDGVCFIHHALSLYISLSTLNNSTPLFTLPLCALSMPDAIRQVLKPTYVKSRANSCTICNFSTSEYQLQAIFVWTAKLNKRPFTSVPTKFIKS